MEGRQKSQLFLQLKGMRLELLARALGVPLTSWVYNVRTWGQRFGRWGELWSAKFGRIYFSFVHSRERATRSLTEFFTQPPQRLQLWMKCMSECSLNIKASGGTELRLEEKRVVKYSGNAKRNQGCSCQSRLRFHNNSRGSSHAERPNQI